MLQFPECHNLACNDLFLMLLFLGKINPLGEMQKLALSLSFVASKGDSQHPTAEFRLNPRILDSIARISAVFTEIVPSQMIASQLFGRVVQSGDRKRSHYV